jgi:uncharacterized protein (DUF305 family)
MQVPYWTALVVHLSSAATYPLFPLVHGWLAGRGRKGASFAGLWGIVLGFAVAGMALLFALGRSGSELGLPGAELRAAGADGVFLRRMMAHHEVGLSLSRIAAARAIHPELRTLSQLMTAEHAGELAIMGSWWASWMGGAVPSSGEGEDELGEIGGVPTLALIDSLRIAPDSTFDPEFLGIMMRHHAGAIAITNEALERPGDPRIDLMALSIRHSSIGQNERMQRMLRRWMGEEAAAASNTW